MCGNDAVDEEKLILCCGLCVRDASPETNLTVKWYLLSSKDNPYTLILCLLLVLQLRRLSGLRCHWVLWKGASLIVRRSIAMSSTDMF
jgi:hypothetical protein